MGEGQNLWNFDEPGSWDKLAHHMSARLASSTDAYVQMNALRDWVNANVPGFELYLEDEWNARENGFTDLEYRLRSLHTLDETRLLAYDRYHNHRDAKGVWHLDDYVSTHVEPFTVAELIEFIKTNRS